MEHILDQIGILGTDLHQLQEKFLRDHGWVTSCDFPDSCWRWVKVFGDKTFVMSFTEAYSLESYIEEARLDDEESQATDA
jgi:hypothetical protein